MMPLPSAAEVEESRGGRARKRFGPLARGVENDGNGEGEGVKRTLQGVVFDVDGTLW